MGDLPRGKPILCVDFDGVIHSYKSGWMGPRKIPDDPVKGVLAFLVLASAKFQVCIYSSRSRYIGGRRAMKKWLRSWGLPPSILRSIKFPTRKPAAFLQIDDRAICFTGTFPTVEEMRAFRPWYRRNP